MQHATNPHAAPNQAQNHYQRMQITTADPFELVLILYREAIQRLHSAAQHLRQGRIQDRVADVSRAQDMIAELKATLDFEQGGDIAKQLERLYGYMLQRLSQANAQQDVEALDEVANLLTTLQSAWEGARENLKNSGSGPDSPDDAQGRDERGRNSSRQPRSPDNQGTQGRTPASENELHKIRLSA